MSRGRFYGVGLGPGDPGLVTIKAADCLRRVDLIYTAASRQSERSVAGGVIAALDGIAAERIELEFPMGLDHDERRAGVERHAAALLRELDRGRNCAFATIGDPLTYSTCGYLIEALRRQQPSLEIEVIPGVNSWSALAAAAGRPLVEDRQELRVVPGYVAPEADELDRLLDGEDAVVLLKTYRSRDRLLALLRERNAAFLYGANLGLAGEFVTADPDELAGRPEEYLSMLLVRPGRS